MFKLLYNTCPSAYGRIFYAACDPRQIGLGNAYMKIVGAIVKETRRRILTQKRGRRYERFFGAQLSVSMSRMNNTLQVIVEIIFDDFFQVKRFVRSRRQLG